LEGLQSDGLFSTDANGRQMVQRRRNDPAKFYEGTEPVAANYYPVNSRIWVQDGQQTQMTVLTDRSQGGTSLADGQIELMVNC
jgi:lysosomal alpha-mannosidase